MKYRLISITSDCYDFYLFLIFIDFAAKYHRRRKLFNIGGGGGGPAWPNSIFGAEGGGGIAKSTYTHACTCTFLHTHVLNIHRIIKTKAMDLHL